MPKSTLQVKQTDPGIMPAGLKMRLKKIFINLSITLTATLLTIFAFELALRTFSLTPNSHHWPEGTDEIAIFSRYHSVLGFTNRENFSGTWKGQKVSHNSLGLRGPEIQSAKPADVKRIIVLGDSQAWGFGVGDHETISARMNEILNLEKNQRYEVLNFGVSGYGTDQSFLRLLLLGLKLQPDAIVLINFWNDFQNNSKTRSYNVNKPVIAKDPIGQECLYGAPVKRQPGWSDSHLIAPKTISEMPILRNLEVAKLLSAQVPVKVMEVFDAFPKDELKPYFNCFHSEEKITNGKEVALFVHEKIKDIAEKRKILFLAVFVPRPKHYPNGESEAYCRDFLPLVQKLGVTTLDIHARAKAESLEFTDLFQPEHTMDHLSVQGSRHAARWISEELLR